MSGVPHPYSIEVSPLAKPEGRLQWAIRRSGTLIERSDRPTAERRRRPRAPWRP